MALKTVESLSTLAPTLGAYDRALTTNKSQKECQTWNDFVFNVY